MFQVVLDEQQRKELSNDIYNTVKNAISKAKQEEQHAKPYLNKKEMAKWLGVSTDTIYKFIRNGLPVANIDGMQLIGKETIINFLKEHEELI
ncbi:helix-turn-helix domain-containing protein [Ligilactobacillus cholophilus]|uniref:helix-turn-helix domain-containing protein n=1 Tax=Ligilactobacillus cholophilus TaxID=3050131 RepID=UPI0025AF73DC|nr:helix-turn-helix domain-containing protein [Ligilactobacillus cholophilus]